MLESTKVAIRAVCGADATIGKEQLASAIALLQGSRAEPEPLPRLIGRKEAARLLGRSTKRVDQLALSGVLVRVHAPGTRRAIGFTESSVRAFVEGKAALS